MSDDPESALLKELQRLAGSKETSFTIEEKGRSIGVRYSGGSGASLHFRARYDAVARADHPAVVGGIDAATYRGGAEGPLRAIRPLAIELRPENANDLAAKRAGLSVEWQSGDALFDREVYVSTHVTDPRVLGAVLGSEVRDAVRELLALGFRHVRIDDKGAVTAHLFEFAQRDREPDRGARAIRAFGAILANLPKIVSSKEKLPPPPLAGWLLALRVIGLVGWGANVGFVGGLLVALRALWPGVAAISTLECVASIGASVLFGMVGAVVFGRMMRKRVQGTSRAHEQIGAAYLAGFGGVSVVSLVVILAAIHVLAR